MLCSQGLGLWEALCQWQTVIGFGKTLQWIPLHNKAPLVPTILYFKGQLKLEKASGYNFCITYTAFMRAQCGPRTIILPPTVHSDVGLWARPGYSGAPAAGYWVPTADVIIEGQTP